jgi:ABC-type oligopeptide transport system substrate-binding subunit
VKEISDFTEKVLLDQILVSDFPVIPIYNAMQTYLHSPKLKGYVFDFSGAVDFSYAYFE